MDPRFLRWMGTVRQKLVVRLGLHDDTEAKKAMRAVESLKGVDSAAIDKKRKEMTVVGVVDPMAIVSELRKFCRADVKSVSPAEEKREESKKGKAEKKGSKKTDEVNTRFEDEAEADESEEALSAPSISRCLDIVDALADMVSSYNLKHGQLSDLLDILRQLGISLRKAQAVLHFAKQQQAKDKELLAQLEAAVLDSEDLLDDLDCQVLQQRMVGDKAVCALALTYVMGQRYLETSKIMPAGVVAALRGAGWRWVAADGRSGVLRPGRVLVHRGSAKGAHQAQRLPGCSSRVGSPAAHTYPYS